MFIYCLNEIRISKVNTLLDWRPEIQSSHKMEEFLQSPRIESLSSSSATLNISVRDRAFSKFFSMTTHTLSIRDTYKQNYL
jgi:hypothetical protein